MKKILRTIGALLLATALVVSLIPVSDVEAVSSTSDFQIEGTKLVKYTGTAEVVSVPDEVRSIGAEAFAGNSDLVKVTINDKCKSIGYGAFSNCIGLHSVIIGNDVEEIDSAAFSNDKSLKNVTLGNSVKKIGSGAFAGDTALTNLVNNSTKLALKDNVLYDKDFEKIIMMLPSYKDYEYIMPGTVNEVMGYAFWGNDSITNVSLSSNLVSVPEYAFSNCSNLRQVTIPLPVRSIDSKAFEDCVNLSVVNCPDSLTQIADTAFDGCPKVTINATTGTYAQKFGQNLKKDKVEEIEYEDVTKAAIVTQQLVTGQQPVTADNETASVQSGTPGPEASTEGNSETASVTASEVASDAVGNDVSYLNSEAKYSSGVINGADVVGYVYYDPATDPTGNLLGSSSIVGGRAMVFIDNNAAVKSGADLIPKVDISAEGTEISSENENKKGIITILPGGIKSKEDNSAENVSAPSNNVSEQADTEENENVQSLGSLLMDKGSKGFDFPKFTIVGNKIASQSYYLDTDLKEYEIPEGITSIGDFSFARSGLTGISIPDGVTSIGYGAFYHCDNLSDVSIPGSVTSIAENAFSNTGFVNNYPGDFVIVGDGILIAYNGNDSVVTIPDGVKLIAAGTFRDHMGITAVNLADSLEVIGEDAFNGCKNLKTLNRGDNVKRIGANAFKDTSLSTVVINPKVESIGLGAFDLDGGTDNVTFLGDTIPILTQGYASKRLANTDDRNYAFGNMTKATVQPGVTGLMGTVLEPGQYGILGGVYDTSGNMISDNSVGVNHLESAGVRVDANSGFVDASSVSARIPGDEGSYYLHITDSHSAKESISLAFSELYGGKTPDNLVGIDMSFRDDTDSVNISKLGKQYVEVSMAIPSGVNANNLHVVCLDEDGQLEAVEYSLSEDRNSVTLKCMHFSPYGFYNFDSPNGTGVVKGGDRIKDDTPDTGDFNLHPKWFLVIGCCALALVLFLLSVNKKVSMPDK